MVSDNQDDPVDEVIVVRRSDRGTIPRKPITSSYHQKKLNSCNGELAPLGYKLNNRFLGKVKKTATDKITLKNHSVARYVA